jgi:polysaccharide export outer membrane protein
MLRKIIFLSGLTLLVSCVNGSRIPIPSVKTLANYQQTEQGSSNSSDSYVIGPGDILSIDVWKAPELSKQVTVPLDGNISLTLVNEVKAAGLTSAQLRNLLTRKYADYLETPTVSVTLVESRSKRIYLLGEVTRPGEYVLEKNVTIVQAISLAGGPSEWANTSDVRLIRRIKGIERHFRVDYDAILSGKDVSQNILLKPEDTIYLP